MLELHKKYPGRSDAGCHSSDRALLSSPMRFRQALALLFLVALCGAATANGASTATIPTCKKGQVSTKAKPCKTAATKVAQPAALSQDELAALADPGDVGGRVNATDAVTIIRFLDPRATPAKYQLEVENTSGIGYINTFNWVPPNQMTITAITSTEGGRCTLNNNTISCRGGAKGIAPPKCTCLAGGNMLINFTATGNEPKFNGQYWTYYGIVGSYMQITSMTPVPYHIPSFLPSTTADVPLCKAGQKSTTAKPCSTI
jgi:hypothetical protein